MSASLASGASPAPRVSTPHGRAALWIFLGVSLLYVGLARGHFYSTDEIAVYEATRSLWEDGSLAVPPILDTFRGRDGRFYSPKGAGQSVAALPLYGLGKLVRVLLERAGREDWLRTLAGPRIAMGEAVWGGEAEVFFVGLWGALATGMLCALFFAFGLRLGVSPRSSLACTALLATTSHAASFGTSFFQHSSEALFLLAAFYFLYRDAHSGPDWRLRAAAGGAGALLLLFRAPSAVALLPLAGYLAAAAARGASGARAREKARAVAERCAAFALPVLLGVAAHLAVNRWRFGETTLAGAYASAGSFSWPRPQALYGYLLSSGASIFLFTPLLVLLPWTLRNFHRRHPLETSFLLLLSATYLVYYASWKFWEGGWCFGPRFLAALGPPLLLPLAPWCERRGRRAWLAVLPLAALGLWVQLLHVAVNPSYVFYVQGYGSSEPPLAYLFVPSASPVVAHARGLLDWDPRVVDFWLLHVQRDFGWGRTLALALPLAFGVVACGWRAWRWVQAAEAAAPLASRVRFVRARSLVGAVEALYAATALALLLDR